MRGGEGGEAKKYKNGSRCFFFILELNYTIKHRSDVEYYLIIGTNREINYRKKIVIFKQKTSNF